LNDKASLFVEANIQAVNYEIAKMTIEKYEIDGEDFLDEMDDDEKEVQFKKDDVDHPAPFMISGSNVAIRGGIKFSIN